MKQYPYTLKSIRPGGDEHYKLVTFVMAELHNHNDSEELNDLPPLEKVAGETASVEVTLSFKRTKKLVPPTRVFDSPVIGICRWIDASYGRGHPSIPNKLLVETAIGLLEAPIDKVKDWFASFPAESEVAKAKEELKDRDYGANSGEATGAHIWARPTHVESIVAFDVSKRLEAEAQ